MSVSNSDRKGDPKEGKINDDFSGKIEALSAQVEANVERGRNAVADWHASLSDTTSELGRKANRYTHEHPWRMISSALLGGVLLGLIVACQGSHRRAR